MIYNSYEETFIEWIIVKTDLSTMCYGFFATLANPTRLAILEQLQSGPLNVSRLA